MLINTWLSLFGVFEAMSREKAQEQFDVDVFGLMVVARANAGIYPPYMAVAQTNV